MYSSTITTASAISNENNQQTNSLWCQESTLSANSCLTSSSGGDNSFDSSEKDNSVNHLDFLASRLDHYYQLMDDLTIIDEIYQTYNDEVESEPYERQVADAARNVAQKLNAVSQICQTEEEYIVALEHFLFYYMEPMESWFEDTTNADVFQKYPTFCFKKALTDLFEISKELTRVHQSFHKGLQERLKMWGPTQFISDIFTSFYEKIIVYEKYMKNFPETIVTIDTLYKRSSGFSNFIENCVTRTNIPIVIKDFLFYLKNPLIRFTSYTTYISQLTLSTEPSHPDYRALIRIKEKFEQRESQWETLIKDRLAHIRVLEASRTIQDNPASVITTRRLIISGSLVKIDISNPHSLNDSRTYLLYNDLFIFCQKKKQNSNSNKLICKGAINLKHAEIMPLSAKHIAKMTEVKKASPFSSFMIRKPSDTNQQASKTDGVNTPPPIFGFEMLVINDPASNVVVTPLRGDGLYFVPGNMISSSNKRLYIMRTQTEAEQNAWISLLRKTSAQISQK
ncbi:MAG: Dbl homology domain-containing protein [Benjaminiella poitrasii]|nr:MAG: Dbl homology domain-containing protein [Benjaminiella poitrasii]